jgi:hypothetical protein
LYQIKKPGLVPDECNPKVFEFNLAAFNELWDTVGNFNVFDTDSSDDEDVDPNKEVDDNEDDEAEVDCNIGIGDELLLFMIVFNISRRAMQSLLDILHRNNVDVPRTVYLLKKNATQPQFESLHLENGNLHKSTQLPRLHSCGEKVDPMFEDQ